MSGEIVNEHDMITLRLRHADGKAQFASERIAFRTSVISARLYVAVMRETVARGAVGTSAEIALMHTCMRSTNTHKRTC